MDSQPASPQESTELLSSPGSSSSNSNPGNHGNPGDDKISGKAWGRVGKFLTNKEEYPKGVFFIVGNEFCERFSYYGMRAILVIYLTQWLGFGHDLATAVYHSFIVLCYFTPLFGAMLADGLLGKYHTILYVSIVYAVGNLVISTTSFPPPFWLGPIIGLVLIGLGTGGIKPCVSAFGGDQFSSTQEKQRNQFFSVFYFAINLGSVFSTIITPILRANVHCFGTSCYPLAFGIPAVLMVISLVLFFLGRKMYKIYPSTGNVIAQSFKCIARALKNKMTSVNGPKEHWLDCADDKFEAEFIEEVRMVLRVLLLFLPLPVFWALFDQQGSRWTLQANLMDRNVFGVWQIPPDLMQSLNPILIILLIPVFETIVYPCLARCSLLASPLQRMCVGMLLAAVSFVVAGFLQLHITAASHELIGGGESLVHLINTAPCTVNMTSPFINTSLPVSKETDALTVISGTYLSKFSATSACGMEVPDNTAQLNVSLSESQAYHVVVAGYDNKLQVKSFPFEMKRSKEGGALVSVIYATDSIPLNNTITIKHHKYDEGNSYNITEFGDTPYQDLTPGSYGVYAAFHGETDIQLNGSLGMKNGGIYTVVIQPDPNDPTKILMWQHTDLEPNSVPILWQIPQYFIITTGEILFSISGLTFAYSQAPASMKSVLQAGWLLTVAGGNLIDVIVAGSQWISSQAVEFFVFAGLMAVMVVVFGIMCYFYTYVDTTVHEVENVTQDNIHLVSQEQMAAELSSPDSEVAAGQTSPSKNGSPEHTSYNTNGRTIPHTTGSS